MATLLFPPDFVWGVGTASYQIEGAYREDGRGLSIWDQFAHTPGKVLYGATGDIACNHYHRWEEDVQVMRELGVSAYRFSLAWSRIFPDGNGHINTAGLDFYDRLVDALLEANIQPFVTLYHWDLPLALHEQGGWARRSIVDHFADYTCAVAIRLGDRVKHWMTINEPAIFTWYGYLEGLHAPGYRDPQAAFQVAHHVLLAHAAAVGVLREQAYNAQVGLALSYMHIEPPDKSEAARAVALRSDIQWNRWFIEPIVHGHYPAEIWQTLGTYTPHIEPDDFKKIQAPLDFLGLNYYARGRFRESQNNAPFYTEPAPCPPNSEITGSGWEIYPDGLYQLLIRFHNEYPVPAYYITENGAAYDDQLTANGRVHDKARQLFLERHIGTAASALREGVPLKGYFPWSLLDNFEWAEGYSQRFGLVYVDYATQQRYLKDSALWYRDFVRHQTIVRNSHA